MRGIERNVRRNDFLSPSWKSDREGGPRAKAISMAVTPAQAGGGKGLFVLEVEQIASKVEGRRAVRELGNPVGVTRPPPSPAPIWGLGNER